jgi:glyoxylate reductase
MVCKNHLKTCKPLNFKDCQPIVNLFQEKVRMKVLITGRLPEAVLAGIEAAHTVTLHREDRPMPREKLLHRIAGQDGLLCMITDTVDTALLRRAPGLKIIANYGVGFNNIDVEAATQRGIPVTNTPGVLTDATADLTFALILAVGRRVVEGDRYTRAGHFKFWAPFHFLGSEISGKTIGIVGMGRIGRAVAKRAAGFDMDILYAGRQRLPLEEENRFNATYADMNTLLARSDFVSLHVPLNEQTRHLVGAEALGRMRPDAFLINTSRGPVVDEAALCEALKHGQIKGAGLDVYEHEPAIMPGLMDLDNIVLLPHAGSATIETRTKMARLAADNLLAGLSGQKPPNCLNWDILCGKRPP